MDLSWIAISFADTAWIALAFGAGFLARQLGLPPLIGFLVAGFILNAIGAKSSAAISEIADLGVTLLLFSIGLKLNIATLLRPQVWGVASGHMLITVVVFGAAIYGLAMAGVSVFAGLDLGLALLLAFALSFSSTVFAVKGLEEKGETSSLHGRIAIGVLIMQDLFAVVFLTLSTGKIPSPWALALFALIPLRTVLGRVMEWVGHGELLILYGLLLALGGAALFEAVGLKADLGALILGVLVANHPKASEMAKALLGFKDLFLVGFFLSIGLSGLPDLESLGVALLLVVAVVFKVALFFVLLTRLRLRARTSLFASLSLANYSEFGLIVGAIGVSNGWISGDWLVIIAIALSLSFILAAPPNSSARALYTSLRERLKRLETDIRLPEEQPFDPGTATIGVFGMGRVGTGAYDLMRERFGDTVLGIDSDEQVVEKHRGAGRNVVHADATDPEYWARIKKTGQGRIALLAMPSFTQNLYAVEQLCQLGFAGYIAVTAMYPDEEEVLREAGAHAVYNFYAEAGAGFAEHITERVKAQGRCETAS